MIRPTRASGSGYDRNDENENATITNDVAVEILALDLDSLSLLDKFEQMARITEKCQLDAANLAQFGKLIDSTAQVLNLTDMQTILLSPFVANFGDNLDKRDLCGFFDCSPIELMRHTDDFEILVHRRYLTNARRGSFVFALSGKATKAIQKNQGLEVRKMENLNPEEFINEVRNSIHECFNKREIDVENCRNELQDLIELNPQLGIVKAVSECSTDFESQLIMLYMCKRLVYDGENNIPSGQISDLIEDYYSVEREMIQGRHELFQTKLLKFNNDEAIYRSNLLSLTDKAKKIFLAEYKIPNLKKSNFQDDGRCKIIKAADIKKKVLYFTDGVQNQVDTLSTLLTKKQFDKICKSLRSNGMREGFNCLFYGAPGTGKTETVLQLARMTGRDIMQVDIAAIRDKFYGETEKFVKEIFDSYAEFRKTRSVAPILLFNEADAILSVRTSIGGANASIEKTENAIQNILLQEMENLKGIMIATTNLTGNLDEAFERRFIYKVKFEQPNLEAKAKIWQSMIPELNDDDAKVLAKEFDLSGGQIENVTRKCFVEKILFQRVPELAHLKELCEQEKLDAKKRMAIGFK